MDDRRINAVPIAHAADLVILAAKTRDLRRVGVLVTSTVACELRDHDSGDLIYKTNDLSDALREIHLIEMLRSGAKRQ